MVCWLLTTCKSDLLCWAILVACHSHSTTEEVNGALMQRPALTCQRLGLRSALCSRPPAHPLQVHRDRSLQIQSGEHCSRLRHRPKHASCYSVALQFHHLPCHHPGPGYDPFTSCPSQMLAIDMLLAVCEQHNAAGAGAGVTLAGAQAFQAGLRVACSHTRLSVHCSGMHLLTLGALLTVSKRKDPLCQAQRPLPGHGRLVAWPQRPTPFA